MMKTTMVIVLATLCACAVHVHADETVDKLKALQQQVAVLRAQGKHADAVPLQEEILALPLGRQQKLAALFDIGANYNHALQQKDKAKPFYLAAIALLTEDAKDLAGLVRARALGRIEHNYRDQIRMGKEADAVAAEIISLYQGALPEAKGSDVFRYRGEVRQYMLRISGNTMTREIRDWDAGTIRGAEALMAATKDLPDAEWIKAYDPVAMINAIAIDEDGRRRALTEIADRVMTLPRGEQAFADAQNGLLHTAANLAKACNSDDLRVKAAHYYRVCGQKLMLGEALFRINHDLQGAIEVFASMPENPDAQLWLAMLEDEPTVSWQLDYAAQELTNWIAKISGRTPDLGAFALGTPASNPEIRTFAGKHKQDFARLAGNDGFIIAAEGGKVFIAASQSKGVLNGVYRFLEKNSDIIWVRELESEEGFGTVYTKDPDFKNTITYLVDVPALTANRDWTGHSHGQRRWQARLLNTFSRNYDGNLNPQLYREISTLGNMSSCGVGLSLELVKKYRDTHPDIFPLEDGKRLTYHDCQLCFANPKTIALFSEEAARVIAGLPKRVDSINIGLGDNWGVCQCEAYGVKPITLPDGTLLTRDDRNFRSTQYAMFVNAVYQNLKKQFPYLKAPGAASYLFTAEAPGVKYLGGGGTYCPYIKNHKKPVYDDSVNAEWHRKAEAFKAAGMPFTGLYEYYLCSSTPQFYHATMEVMQQDLNYYAPALRGCYLDVVYHDGADGLEHTGNGGVYDASAIEFWVCSRLMWNPGIDVRAARHEFCRRAYHEAAGLMIEYYDKMAGNYNADPAGCFWNDEPVAAAKHYVVEKHLAGWLRDILGRAEAAAADPRCRELIRRHRVHMEWLVTRAEQAPKQVELLVPQAAGAPDSSDPASAYWKGAAVVAPLTAIGNAAKPAAAGTAMHICHDVKHLYLLLDLASPGALATYREYEKAGRLRDGGTPPDENFDWSNCVELFLDAGLRSAGSYYHLPFMFNGQTYVGQGPTRLDNPPEWHVKITPKEDGLRAIATFPLAPFGVEISKGNKLGAMFLANGAAWNGGQWHSPTAFQTLVLEMK